MLQESQTGDGVPHKKLQDFFKIRIFLDIPSSHRFSPKPRPRHSPVRQTMPIFEEQMLETKNFFRQLFCFLMKLG